VFGSLTAILTWRHHNRLDSLCGSAWHGDQPAGSQFVLINRSRPLAAPERTSTSGPPAALRLDAIGPLHASVRRAWALLASGFPHGHPMLSRARPCFAARGREQERFVLVAATIWRGSRSRFKSIEADQRTGAALLRSSGGQSGQSEPACGKLSISAASCRRYLDATAYSLRIGETGSRTVYRIKRAVRSVTTTCCASPTRNNPGPNRSCPHQCQAPGFPAVQPEPGLELMRAPLGKSRLGHLYLYARPGQADEKSTRTETEVAHTG